MSEAREPRPRVAIESVRPEIDCGRYPIKRTLEEKVVVEADAFADGHDCLSCLLLHRWEGDDTWHETAMEPLGNDRWRGEFPVLRLGRFSYTVEAWVDGFATWRRDLQKKVDARQDVATDLLMGAALVRETAGRAPDSDARVLRGLADDLSRRGATEERLRLALDEELARIVARYPDRRGAARYPRELPAIADRERARFSTWYEMFPRSASPEAGRAGTFEDTEARLPYVAEMGFDVLYLPPIHPIGRTHRKGENSAIVAAAGDVGSPWAIGSEEGGHKAIHPDLGTLEEFRSLVERARGLGIEIALDIAFQCSPDHPYVQEHPEWFKRRPDGTVQYAENPPKKYQDIYPFDFETDAWWELWQELASIFRFWMEQGVRIFRVDNPHTKPFPFWEWLIGEIKATDPDVIFLSEAFTRPKVMYRLAKLGFTQSYNYFPWRNTKGELTDYFTELTKTEVTEFFRPSLWPNTPDILTERLQFGGRPAFVQRLILAATLGASYGIYGPPFELMENRPREPGSEEYLDSEKYQIRHWNLERSDSLKELIARVNRVRRENPALQSDRGLEFHPTDNEHLLCYSKATEDRGNAALVVVNLDPHHTQSGWVDLRLDELGIGSDQTFQVHDLMTGARFLWQGPRNYVELNPRIVPAHLFRVLRRVRSEQDFDYFM